MAGLTYIELKRNYESKCVDILCDDCAKTLNTDLTDREKQVGYRYIIRPYSGPPRECMDCGKPGAGEKQGAAYGG